MTNKTLMEYFNFDEADLQANRNGEFTNKQKTHPSREDRLIKTGSLVIGILIFALAIFIIYMSIPLRSSSTFELVVELAFVLIIAFFGVRLLRRAFKKYEINLKKVEGPIHITKDEIYQRHGGVRTISRLIIGSVRFISGENASDYLTEGDVYAIYYDAGSEYEILSIELISKKE